MRRGLTPTEERLYRLFDVLNEQYFDEQVRVCAIHVHPPMVREQPDTLAYTHYPSLTITFSPRALTYRDPSLPETMFHEMCHLKWPSDGHGDKWRAEYARRRKGGQ